MMFERHWFWFNVDVGLTNTCDDDNANFQEKFKNGFHLLFIGCPCHAICYGNQTMPSDDQLYSTHSVRMRTRSTRSEYGGTRRHTQTVVTSTQ